jgi:hypothetical protein
MTRTTPHPLLLCLAAVAVIVVAAPVLSRAGVAQPDIAAIRGDQSRALLGDGKGVIIAVVDGGVDVGHPAIAGSLLAAKDFSKSGTTDDDRTDVGHGTGIAGIYVGHDTINGYLGLAPAAQLVNARVTQADGTQTDKWIGNGIGFAVGKGAKIINLSLGETDPNPNTNNLNLMVDYIAEHNGVLCFVAAGNENASASGGAPNANYNAMTVGATGGPSGNFDQVTGFSNYALDSDVRSKPDIVAPGENVTLAAANWETSDTYRTDGTGTSFAAPMAGGIAAQLMGYGKAHHLSTDPLVIKAVMMAGATKVSHFDGGAWAPRDEFAQAVGTLIDEPLDAEEGAGRVDGVGAYDIYARKTDQETTLANWKLGRLKQSASFTMKLGSLKAGAHVDAALTWYRHVSRANAGGGGLDGSDKFTQAASLANFSLTLVRNGTKLVTSDSSFDNLEFLSIDVDQKGKYTLVAERLAGTGISDEPFGLAARVLSSAAADTVAGAGQSAALLRVRDGTLATQHAGLESFNPSGVAQLPEPSGIALAFGVAAGAMLKRRRRYSRPVVAPPL